jgi:hypothetical protein
MTTKIVACSLSFPSAADECRSCESNGGDGQLPNGHDYAASIRAHLYGIGTCSAPGVKRSGSPKNDTFTQTGVNTYRILSTGHRARGTAANACTVTKRFMDGKMLVEL